MARRDASVVVGEPPRRQRIIDPYLEKVEELVERARGDIRADVVHREHLVPVGFAGDERTTRRAVALAKAAWLAGRRRTYRPWIPEPGMWLQLDWGAGPAVRGRKTTTIYGRLDRVGVSRPRDRRAVRRSDLP